MIHVWNKTRVSILLAATIFMSGCQSLDPALQGGPQAASAVPDMLERTLPAIVTVGVYKASTIGTVYGYSAAKPDIAYQKPLSLAGAKSTGSGFIIELKGKKYVVTNAHVIDHATDQAGSIFAYSINRTKYQMRVLGGDSFYDVAVLEFVDKKAGDEIATVSFRVTEPRIGEQVFAIGNPLGDFPYTVTQGIIGGKNRVRGGLTGKFGYLQSSATTIWGNSGGPLVDSGGQVVGINSQIHIAPGPFGAVVQPQLNFALESAIARRVINDIIDHGRVTRAYLGLTVTQEAPSQGGTSVPRIEGLLPGSPAAKALSGREGYRISTVNGVDVGNVEEVLGELEKVLPGSVVELALTHNEETIKVSLTTGELTRKEHEKLAGYFLRSFFSLDLMKDRTDLELNAATDCGAKGACGVRSVWFERDPETDDVTGIETVEKNLYIVAVGSIVSMKSDNSQLWWINNRANLGMTLRLTALNGSVSLVLGDQDKVKYLTAYLTDDGKTLLRTLLY